METLKPDQKIVRRLKRIDPALSVEWVPTARGPRWGVFYGLQVFDRYENAVDVIAREFQYESAKHGYLFGRDDCALAARDAVHMGKLVCYVAEEDGSFAPLDGRIVEKVQRMDYWRKNWGLKDWRAYLKIKADAMSASRQRAADEIWDPIRRDPVFARQVSDILWGMRPARSVIVPDNYVTSKGPLHAASAVARS